MFKIQHDKLAISKDETFFVKRETRSKYLAFFEINHMNSKIKYVPFPSLFLKFVQRKNKIKNIENLRQINDFFKVILLRNQNGKLQNVFLLISEKEERSNRLCFFALILFCFTFQRKILVYKIYSVSELLQVFRKIRNKKK